MPSNPLSLQLTKTYRHRLDATRERLQRLAVERWPTIEALDSTDWSVRMAQAIEQGQTEAVRATAGYLSGFLTLELGKRTKGPSIDSRFYAGKAADGGTLAKSMESPLIGVLARLQGGSDAEEALAYGLGRAKRQVGMDLDAAHRAALLDGIHNDERFDGWQRATRGTCGACIAVAGELHHSPDFPVHPGCGCVSQPVVSGVPNNFPLPTGTQLFATKSEAEQNEALGPKAAALVRAGVIELDQLVEHETFDSNTAPIITQRPVDQLVTATN